MLDYSRFESKDLEEDWHDWYSNVRTQALHAIFGPGEFVRPGEAGTRLAWPGGGFFRFPPRPDRNAWHFVTHGLSQPFDFEDFENAMRSHALEDLESGFGVECVISTRVQEEWPAALLEKVALYMLQTGRTVYPGHRLPSSDLMFNSSGGGLLGVVSPEYDNDILFPAGRCQLVHLVGVTVEEIEHARTYDGTLGSKILAGVLRRSGLEYVTDRQRTPVTRMPDFSATWKSVESHLDEWPVGEAVR